MWFGLCLYVVSMLCVLPGCVAVKYTAVLLLRSCQLLVQGIFYIEIFLGRILVCDCWMLYITVKVTVAGLFGKQDGYCFCGFLHLCKFVVILVSSLYQNAENENRLLLVNLIS